MLGRLTWAAIPFNEPLPLLSGAVVAIVILIALVLVTLQGWWPYLWREWLTSVDHKRIGVMYVLLALVMLLRGFSDAIMMRTQQAIAVGDAQGYLPAQHYDQIFSAHGTIMIFFVAMPLVIGLMNFAVPLQLGVRDVAFPVLNSVSFWLTATGALLVNLSLVIGAFARTGNSPFRPMSASTTTSGHCRSRALAPCSTHGVHVTGGLIWLTYLVAQVAVKGLRAAVLRRLLCWSLFWHALDIVWVGVFTLVYLMGDIH